jgi:hypothetical protein
MSASSICGVARDFRITSRLDTVTCALNRSFNSASSITQVKFRCAMQSRPYIAISRRVNLAACAILKFPNMTTVTHLECSVCAKRYEAGKLHNLCECGGPLLVRYDLQKAKESWSRDSIPSGPSNMWRYAPVLPVSKPSSIVSLGEGMTPLIETKRLGARLGANELWVKDEGINPTGSFKARGLSCAVSMAVELGVKRFHRREMRRALWRLTRPRRESRRTSLCPRMCRNRISSNVRRPARR